MRKIVLNKKKDKVNKGSCVIVENDGKILALKRSEYVDWMPNKWNFPGGSNEYGETPKQTALRECKEETGISLDDATFLCKMRKDDGFFYVFKSKSRDKGVEINEESSDYKWVDEYEIFELDFLPNLKKILSIYNKYE